MCGCNDCKIGTMGGIDMDRFYLFEWDSSVFMYCFHAILNIDLLFKLFRFRLRSSSTKSSALWHALMNTPPAWHSRCRPAFMAQQDDFCYKARFLVWSLRDGFCDHQVVQDFSDHCDLSRPLRKQSLGLGVPNWAGLRSPVSSKMLLKLWNFHIVLAKATNSCESWHVEIGHKVYVRSASSLFWSDLECCRCGRCPPSSCTSLASCRFESKPCYWLRAPGRTARIPHWILRLLWRCSISKWVFKADVEDFYKLVSHFCAM